MRHGWACLPRGNAEKSNMADLTHGRFTHLRGEAHGKLALSLHQEETKKKNRASSQPTQRWWRRGALLVDLFLGYHRRSVRPVP